MKTEMTYSFGTDFHGNLKNIDAFLQTSKQAGVDHVIFGGDVAPKKMGIRLKGNTAFPYRGRNEEISTAQIESADKLQEEGYMLLAQTDIDPGALQRIARITHDCVAYQTLRSHHGDESDIHLEDFPMIEKYLVPLIVQFLRTEFGKRLFERYVQETNYPTAEQHLTPEKFAKCYLYRLKNDYALSRRLFGNTDAISQLYFDELGHSLEEARPFMELGMRATVGDFQVLIRSAFQHALPWMQWRIIYDNMQNYAPEEQRTFARELLRRIQNFRQTFHGSISLILGNDDDPSLSQIFDDADANGLIRHATNRVVDISPNLHMLGYSNVPPIEGIALDDWFKTEAAINGDLSALAKQMRSDMMCIANIHVPPGPSPLAKAIVEGKIGDFGSTSVRRFLEEQQPQLALCGHIHRAWEVTHCVCDRIGATTVFNPGDSEYNPRILIGSITQPQQYTVVTPTQ